MEQPQFEERWEQSWEKETREVQGVAEPNSPAWRLNCIFAVSEILTRAARYEPNKRTPTSGLFITSPKPGMLENGSLWRTIASVSAACQRKTVRGERNGNFGPFPRRWVGCIGSHDPRGMRLLILVSRSENDERDSSAPSGGGGGGGPLHPLTAFAVLRLRPSYYGRYVRV